MIMVTKNVDVEVELSESDLANAGLVAIDELPQRGWVHRDKIEAQGWVRAPDSVDVADFLGAIIANDLRLARLLAPRVFLDREALDSCQLVLTLSLQRAA